MDEKAYQSYAEESDTWLKRGRTALIDAVLDRHVNGAGALRVLEVGAGVGQNLPTLTKLGGVDVVEIDDRGLAALRQRDDVGTIFDRPVPFDLPAPYDVVCAFDVVEHLPDDAGSVSWMFEALKPGGHFVATVPAYQWMFSWHDVALHHFRRYTRSGFAKLVRPHGQVLQDGYFVSTLFPLAAATRVPSVLSYRASKDPAAAPARKQSGAVGGLLDRGFSAVLDAEVALIRRGVRLPGGLSIFLVAQKPG